MRGPVCIEIFSGRMDKYLFVESLDNELIPSIELLVDSDHEWVF